MLVSALTVGCFYGVANAGAATVYDSIPDPPPGNVPSEAFEAQAVSELGDRVTSPAATASRLRSCADEQLGLRERALVLAGLREHG